MSTPSRVLIAGAGRFGTLHARVWTEAGAQVTGVVDTSRERAATLATATSAGAHGEDLETVLAESQAEIVVIASDESSHADLALRSLAHGAHTFVEKPFAMDLAQATDIVLTAESQHLHAFAGHISRFAEPYRYLRSAIETGRIGTLWGLRLRRDFSRTWYENFGDRVHPAWESCVHDIDLAIYFADAQPVQVYATQSEAAEEAAPSILSALVKFDTGVTATIESAWALPDAAPRNLAGALELDGTIAAECEVIGAHGVAKQRLVSDSLSLWTEGGVITPDLSLWPEVDGRISGALRSEVDSALAVFRGERDNDVMPHTHAVRAVSLAEALVRSLDSGLPEPVTPTDRTA